jgi:hypothetical protein
LTEIPDLGKLSAAIAGFKASISVGDFQDFAVHSGRAAEPGSVTTARSQKALSVLR